MPNENNKTQNVMQMFCTDPHNLEHVMYVENIDAFCVYHDDEGYYKIFNDDQMYPYVFDFIKERVDRDVSPNFVKSVTELIKWKIFKKRSNIDSDYIAFKDKLLNMNTFEIENFHIDKPAFHKVNVLSADVLSQSGNTPLFTKFIDEVLIDKEGNPDKELQMLVQEALGYMLLNTIEAHAVFFFVGGGQNGKSVLLNILREIIGDEFVSSMNIESLTTQKWSTAALVGKKVNICNEEESSFVKSDKFKAIVSGDPVEAQHKFGKIFSLRPTTKYVFGSNSSPKFEGIDGGLIRRIHIIPFYKRIEDHLVNTGLTKELLTEKPGIMAWMIEGAERLVKNKFKFTKSKTALERKVEFETDMSSALIFMSDEYEVSTNESDFMANEDLYMEYDLWCGRVGRRKMNLSNFFKDLSNVYKQDTVVRYSAEKGKNVRGRFLKRKEVV